MSHLQQCDVLAKYKTTPWHATGLVVIRNQTTIIEYMKSKITKLCLATVCALGLALTSQATLIDYSTMGVGNWDPGSKYNNPVDATLAANGLVTWHNGGVDVNTVLTEATFTLGTASLGVLPGPLSFSFKDETGPAWDSFDASLYSYVLGKYGNVTYLFYLGNETGIFELPEKMDSGGLSHEIAFTTRESTSVPDGGMTLMLLGSAFAGLGTVRRFIKR
jgi:hypothetical protein